MKKSKTIILLLSLFFMFIGVVSAKEDPFSLDWREKESFYETTDSRYAVLNLRYRNGYLAIYTDEDDYSHIRYYDNDGSLIKEKKLNDSIYGVLDAVTNDENVFLLVNKYDYGYNDDYYYNGYYYDSAPQIIKLDDNFNIEEAYDLYDETVNYYNYDYPFIRFANVEAPFYGMSTLSIVNDRLYILGTNFEIRSFDLNLGTIKTVKSDENSVKKYFPEIYYLYMLSYESYRNDDDYYFISSDVSDKNVAYSKTVISDFDWLDYFFPSPTPISLEEESLDPFSNPPIIQIQGGTSTYITSVPSYPMAYIGLLDKAGKIEWEVENKNYYFFTNVKLINEYIVAQGMGEYGNDVVIYDLDGKVVQTIKSKYDGYQFLASTTNGFLVTDIEATNQCYYYDNVSTQNQLNGIATINDDPDYCKVVLTTEHYALPYNINVDLDGEAEVKANEQSFAGKKETIEVIPKEGYKVDSIIVTDAEGNVLEVEDNAFTMPASDVNVAIKIVEIEEEIEEPPVIENPNTNAFSITGIAIVTVGLGIVGIRYFKKLRFLK